MPFAICPNCKDILYIRNYKHSVPVKMASIKCPTCKHVFNANVGTRCNKKALKLFWNRTAEWRERVIDKTEKEMDIQEFYEEEINRGQMNSVYDLGVETMWDKKKHGMTNSKINWLGEEH